MTSHLFTPPTNGRKIRRAFLHCDAISMDRLLSTTVRINEINRWHKIENFRPFLIGPNRWHFGYNLYIGPDDEGHVVRPYEFYPQAQSGYNSDSVACCCRGLYLEEFTSAALSLVSQWVEEIYAWDPTITFHGHKEVAAKACPVYDYASLLGITNPSITGGHLGGFITPPSEPTYLAHSRRLLSTTATGEDVRELQTLLGDIKVDGIFGGETLAAVLAFQRAEHIQPDGVVGPITWEHLFDARRN